MKKIIITLVVFMCVLATQAQEAPSRGFLLPRLTTAERTAMVNPAKGVVIFNTDTNKQEINTGTGTTPVWSVVAASSSSDVNTFDGAIKIGNIADGSGTAGMIRFNTTTNKFQAHNGTAWEDLH